MRKSDDLKAEYLLLQGQYEAYDQRALSLKALAAPLLGAVLVYGVQNDSRLILAAAILVALSLWLLEAIWKGFQYSFINRIELIEAWFRGETMLRDAQILDEEPPFQIFHTWMDSYSTHRKIGNIIHRMKAPFVFLPYLVVVIAGGIALFVI